MNLPNILTIVRILLTVIFAMFTQVVGATGALLAFFVFILAAATDFADGYIARKYNLITTFGKIMDPVADKLLTLTALFIFAFEGTILLWMAALVAFREILITAVRIHALTVGKVIPAESSGKVKTVLQMMIVALILIYRFLSVGHQTSAFVKNHQYDLLFLINGVMIMTLFVTVWSGAVFFRNLMEKS